MSTEATKQITYGNLRKPGLPGLFSLSAGATVGMGVGALVLIGLSVAGQLKLAFAWLLVLAVLTIPLVIPTRSGQTPYVTAFRFVFHRRAARLGLTGLRQGVTGHVPDGNCRLPGLAAATVLTEHRDVYGQPFGLISVPATAHHTVVIEAHAAGTAGVDQSTIDGQVAHWGAWLANLGQTGDIAGAAVVVETAPDSGHRLRRAATSGMATNPPAFARAVLDEVLDSYPTGSPIISTRITVTFKGRSSTEDGGGGKALSIEEIAEEIGTRLPQLISDLRNTGAGTTSRPCSAQEIVDATRVAFDPSVAAEVEQASLGAGTGLTWDQAGPVAHDALYDAYRHESAYSVSWHMKEPPAGIFYSTSLQRLLNPHRDITRKRVAILYRPEDPMTSAHAVEQDVNYVTWRASQRAKVPARTQAELAAAQRAASEEAHGASLVRFGIIVTATVMSADALPLARKTITTGLAAQARLRLRLARGSQDVAFLASLPLGMVLPEHMMVPTVLRESL